MEIWDAYNERFEKIEGMSLIRGEKIPEGIYHLVSDIIVRHRDGDYLLMQRDSRKHFGGMWEATAGGSAIQGEGPLECAIRELREETGIASQELTEVGRVISRDTIYVEFLCITDCRKGSIVLQEGETSAYKWVSKDALISMKKEELVTERMQSFVDELKPTEIRAYKAFRLDEIVNLYSSVGWSNYLQRVDILQQAYENSLCVLGAYDGDKLTGIIRAVGDGLSVVFIQDIIVLPEYQRKGIGTRLLRAVMDRYRDVYQMELLTDDTEKTRAFYRSAGFTPSDEMNCLAYIRM